VKSLSGETVLHKIPQCESFPRAVVLHKLPQHGSFPQVQSFRNRLLQHGLPTGSQALPTNLLRYGVLSPEVHRSWQEPAPARGSPWDHSLLWTSTCSGMASLIRAASRYLLHHRSPWAAGGQPASLWSSSWPVGEKSLAWHLEYLLPLLLHRPWCLQTSFSHIVPLLSLHCHFTAAFFPLLEYVITEMLPLSLFGLALASSKFVLEPAGTGFTRHGRSFLQLLTEATPVAPPLPKICHANPQHMGNSFW